MIPNLLIFILPGDTTCSPPFSKSGLFCFHFDQSAGSFTEKRTSCAALGGFLVKVNSTQKAAAVYDFMTGNFESLQGNVVVTRFFK